MSDIIQHGTVEKSHKNLQRLGTLPNVPSLFTPKSKDAAREP